MVLKQNIKLKQEELNQTVANLKYKEEELKSLKSYLSSKIDNANSDLARSVGDLNKS